MNSFPKHGYLLLLAAALLVPASLPVLSAEPAVEAAVEAAVVDAGPVEPEWIAAISRGDSALSEGKFARSLDEYEHASRLAPQSATPFLRIAHASYRWGDAIPLRRNDLWSSALQNVQRARKLDSLSADAAFLEAVLRYRMGDTAGAGEVYQELEKIRQGDADLYLDLALVAARSGNREAAMKALDRARTLQPSSPRLFTVAKEILEAPLPAPVRGSKKP